MSRETVDPLLAALASAAREEGEEEAALARFAPLAQADLPEEERARLEAEAAQAPGGDELLALLRPIDDAARGRMAAAAAAALRGGAASPRAPEAAREGVVVPLRPRARPWRGAAAVASALAIAAGVTLYVTTRGSSPALPAYEASIAGGLSTTRAPGDAPPTLVPGKPFRVRLRPEQAVAARVTAMAALRQGERLTQLDGATQTFEGGAVGMELTVPADVPPGPAELILLVAGAGDAPAAVPADPAADDGRRRAVRLAVVIGSP